MLASILTTIALVASAAAATAPEPLLWFRTGHLTPQAAQVLDALHRADAFGLEPADYELDAPPGDERGQSEFDAALSQATARFVRDLHSGRIDPRSVGFHLPAATARDLDIASAVRELATSPDVAATLDTLEPRPIPYWRLKGALAKYRRLVRDIPSVQLPPLPSHSVGAGSEYSGAPQLRHFLRAVGDLDVDDSSADVDSLSMDASLVAAIRHFQRRHGIDDDGVIGRQTFASLTTPLTRRIEQIELSMERWRWLSAIERPNIVVNIPQFRLIALPREQHALEEPLEMRAIVGQTATRTRTPVFTSAITQVVFQPYWDVPSGILHREILPHLRANPSLLDRYEMEIVQGEGDDARVVSGTRDAIERLAVGKLRLRQRPGALNALGPVKFVMPNPYSVYLHATPERALFERSQRTFSHGCIRVSEPAALAEYVLRNAAGTWDAQAIDAAMCGKETLRIQLLEPVRVVVFYSTAMATKSEGILFFDDVYGLDRKLQEALDARRTQQ
ncbi:MAG TPA: L,D-transpeptidase family protein [Steroidobacteraceae bacterium]|nr:L,D-transpeptidase family protein [Steroidobacteraceae bacterium]